MLHVLSSSFITTAPFIAASSHGDVPEAGQKFAAATRKALRDNYQSMLLITGTSTIGYAALSPLTVQLITDVAQWPSIGDVSITAGVMGAFSGLVVFGLIPAGHLLQKGYESLRFAFGKMATIGLETIASVTLLETLAMIYGWDPLETLQTGVLMGLTQGLPLSTISHRWGDQKMTAVILRQGAMMTIQTNVAVMNSLSAQRGVELSLFEMSEIIGVNLGIAMFFSAIPTSWSQVTSWWQRTRFNPLNWFR